MGRGVAIKSKYFKFEEFYASDVATRLGLDNRPPTRFLLNLQRTASMLDEIRATWGFPIRITSGFRCKALNDAVHGAKTSAHLECLAVDIQPFDVKKHSCIELARFISRTALQYDQLIMEGTWVHLGLAEGRQTPRRQNLRATFDKTGAIYQGGLE